MTTILKAILRLSFLSSVALLLGACGGTPSCMEPQPYQASHPGKRIEVTDGLDPLPAAAEMTIPDVSPRPPRPNDAPCLEYPPSFKVSGGEDTPVSDSDTTDDKSDDGDAATDDSGAAADDGKPTTSTHQQEND